MAVLVLFSKEEIINSYDRLENLGIGIEVSEGVFDNENPEKVSIYLVLTVKEHVKIFNVFKSFCHYLYYVHSKLLASIFAGYANEFGVSASN